MSLPAEPFFQRLVEHAAVAVIATDAAFSIVSWNAAAESLLGVEASRMLGRPLEEAVPPERRAPLAKLMHRVVQQGEMEKLEVRLTDGMTQRDVLIVLSPIPGEQEWGPAQGVAAWVLDQTPRTRLSERLVEAEKMASLGTLAGGVAQHFNSILGGVGTFVDFALTSGDPQAMRRALQMAAEAAARAAQITHSLLSFSEPPSHRADLADLTEVVLTFSHLVERPLTEKNIELLLDLHPVPIVAVEANRMHQALGNLLTNAEEAMPAGGQVAITVDRRGEDVVLIFADSGNGIKHEHLPLVFEPFFTTKGLLGGDRANPGLGLSVVHSIAVEMGGRIEVQSDEGHGAKFILYFPVEKATHGYE
ncbi:MAG: ATP-binding protein [Phycisphaerae bacterium]|nr:ATP-binding protein [Phycisphaerae bacterium]